MISRYSLSKDRIKFVLLEGIHKSAVDVLKRSGYDNVVQLPGALDGDALIETIADAHFLGIRSRTQLTRSMIESATKLNAVGCFCIGTNQVDLVAAAERGIPVFNAPFSNTRSVAELVIGEIILLMRNIPAANALLHRRGWMKSAKGAYEVRGKTLGIVGYGHIGTQLSVLAEGLGLRVVFYDIVNKLPLGNAQAANSLEELLAVSDVVSLHVPETPATTWMIGDAELKQMKQGSLLINASRGKVVVIDALVKALESGHIRGAAIDVFPEEPGSNGDVFNTPLANFENVILTPHIGGSTQEAQEGIGVEVASKLALYSNNGSTESAVNFPEVSLPEHAGTTRMLHIHRNVPGMLSKINAILAQSNLNIAGQYLRTDERLGYAVIDIDGDLPGDVMPELSALPGTVRSRVLY